MYDLLLLKLDINIASKTVVTFILSSYMFGPALPAVVSE